MSRKTFSARLRLMAAPLLLLGLCLAAYGNSLHNGFMMDDQGLLVNNPAIHDPGFFQMNFLFQDARVPGGEYAYFRPLPHWLYTVTWSAFGSDVFYYHAINLLLFYLCCCALYDFVRILFGDVRLALLTAVIFCLHPVNGLLVNYITAIGFSAMILAMLLGMLAHLKAPLWGIPVSLLCFLAALLCHETAVMFPVYLAAVLYFSKQHSLKSIFLRLIPSGVLLLAYLIFRMQYASLETSVLGNIGKFGISVMGYVTMLADQIAFYLGNIFLLKDIVLIRAAPFSPHPVFPIAVLLMLAAVLAGLLARFRRRDPKAFAAAWILAGLCPVALAVFSRPSLGFIIQPHWLFFPTIGLFILASNFLLTAQARLGPKPWLAAVIAIAGILLLSTRQYNRLWGNEKAYCQYMLKLSPQMDLPHFWLAHAYLNERNYPQAREHFLRSLLGTPRDWEVYGNLGVIEFEQQNYDRAMAYFDKAVELNPVGADSYYNIGLIYKMRGNPTGAETFLKKSLELNYYLSEARMTLAQIYIDSGRADEAANLLSENLKINPDDRGSRLMLRYLGNSP
ncbi:MAG: tetratricopeptide repeat protein [Candidatus Omnitrophota bacterium]|nr:tetratricopeptide repeat protein [Candidatus Omnitrophota bacterium]